MGFIVAPLLVAFKVVAASSIGSIALNLLGSVALSALSAALAPKPKPSGLRTETTLKGGLAPDSFMLGATATAGVFLAPAMSHGNAGKTPNAFLNYVIEVAGIPGHQLQGLILNGERVDILSTDPHPTYGQRIGGDYTGRAWIRYYDGTQTAADPMLLAKYPVPYVRPWTADMVGEGICYAVLTFQYDREVFSGWPECRFELSGVPLYDPRLDSTVDGGSGPQRWLNRATWAPSNNTAVQVYNVMRGVAFPGGDIWGGDIPAEDLPLSVWMAEMDLADDLVDDGDGGTEPQYRTGFEARADDEPFSVIEELLKGANGQVSEAGGVWSIRLGGPRLPVLFMSDGDIIADEPEDFAPFPPLDQIFNAISATHPDPAINWEAAESELITNEDWEAEDGGRRLTASLTLPAVPYPVQVVRITNALIEDHRRMRRHVLTLPPYAAAVEALDTITWTSESNSYSHKLFEVTEAIRDLRTQQQRVSLREVDPDDYDIPPALTRPSPPSPNPVRPAPQAVAGFAVAPYTLTIDGTARRGGIFVSWDPEGADDARGVRVAIRRQGQSGDGIEQPLYQVATGGAVITDGVLAGPYEVRARYDVDRRTSWTGWAAVTVPDVPLTIDDLNAELVEWLETMGAWIEGGVDDLPSQLAGLAQEIEDEALLRAQEIAAQAEEVAALAQELEDEAAARAVENAALATEIAGEAETRAGQVRANAEALRAERDRIRQVAAEVMELAAEQHLAREELRTQVQAQFGDVSASFEQLILTQVTESSAVALRFTEIEAETSGLSSQITLVDQARIDGDEALASQVAALSVGTAAQFDHTEIWYFDTETDGWTGAPNLPTVTAPGWLRPGDASSAISPAGLAAPGGTYSQVRARIRRVGAPTWLGQLWWADEAQGWDAGRRVTLDEPAFSTEGGAEITFNPGWSGNIDQIRLDLADGADAANYYEFDWLAVGRPAPGASSAELLTERQARIAEDLALASSIEALDARLVGAEGGVEGNANAIELVEARVEATEEGLTSVATRTTALEATVDDPAAGVNALAGAVVSLTAQVESLDDGSQVVQSSEIRNLRAELRRVAAEGMEAAARTETRQQDVRGYVADATQTLTTRIDATDDQVTVQSQFIVSLFARVENAEGQSLAQGNALTSLTATVVDQGAAISVNSAALTSLTAAVAGKADSSAVTALTARVTATEGQLTTQAGQVTTLQSTVGDLTLGVAGNSTALGSLTTRVTAAEGQLTTQAGQITSLESNFEDLEFQIGLRATSAALAALTTRVTASEGAITTQASQIATLQSTVNNPSTGVVATSTALGSLTTRVTSAEGVNTTQAGQIASLQSTVNNPTTGVAATSTALGALTTRVTSAEGVNSTQASQIASLQSTVNNPATGVAATSTAVGALTTRVTAAEGQISTQAAQITTLQSNFEDLEEQLGTRASSAALNALTTRVTATENGLTTLAGQVTSLSSAINNPTTGLAATSTAVASLGTQVTNLNGVVAAQATALTDLNSTVGDVTAGARFLMQTQAAPAGFARVGFRVRAGTSGAYNAASMFLDAPTDPSQPSRVAINADQFVIRNPSGGALYPPFFISGGNIWFGGNLQSASFTPGSGNTSGSGWRLLQNGTAEVESLIVRRNMIVNGAVTDFEAVFIDGDFPLGSYGGINTWQTVLSLEIDASTLGQAWSIAAGGDVLRLATIFGSVRVVRDFRKVSGGAWSGVTEVSSLDVPAGENLRDFSFSEQRAGKYFRIRYHLQIRRSADANISLHRDLILTAQRIVR